MKRTPPQGVQGDAPNAAPFFEDDDDFKDVYPEPLPGESSTEFLLRHAFACVGYPVYFSDYFQLRAAYRFVLPTINGVSISSLLATNQTRWLATYPLDSGDYFLGEIGITNYIDYEAGIIYDTMFNTAGNYFGLPFLSAKIAWDNSGGNTILSAGNTVENIDGYFYPEAAQPKFRVVEYDWWLAPNTYRDVFTNETDYPGMAGLSVTHTNPVLVTSVGNYGFWACYAKLAVTNSVYSGVYGFLQQYFEQAYQVDTNGNITTNKTGILSPYGSFLATMPGQVALVTMPDVDTGARGTGIVSCISVNLNKSRSGGMDLSFNGPDVTTRNSPYVLWANQNFDRSTLDADDSTNYEDDVKAASNPGTSVPQPDCNYSNRLANGYTFRAIPTKRDLEDFTRLWVCGITTNLIAALPSGSTITLNWGDVGNQNPGNPTIDLFTAADADGGMGYLTNETVAAIQTNIFQCPYIGRLGPGGSIQLNAIQFANGWAGNHFIWCGVSNGTGGLKLTITDGSGNVLAQSTAYIQIVDIKQMYERWTVGDNPAKAPTNTATLVTDGLAAGVQRFQYTMPTDTNTPYILYVHGWNMEPWEKDRFAETAFKRLYWQGYQGRFGSFRWPTYYDFGDVGSGSKNTPLNDPRNFDDSEFNAWRSGLGLCYLLANLYNEYPGHVYMFAHSMGNIVAGEALRYIGANQLVNTYVASQAAISAHAYDDSLPNSLFPSGGEKTPNIYNDWFAANNGGGALRVVNFYNTNDFALSIGHWGLDQQLKPDNALTVFGGIYLFAGYPYTGNAKYTPGSVDDTQPWLYFGKETMSGFAPFNLNLTADRYEVSAYAAQARATALGRTIATQNVAANVALQTLWPPDTDPRFQNSPYGEHFYHSAEFRGDCSQGWNYWNTLLFSRTLGFNINNQ